jgi:transketolase
VAELAAQLRVDSIRCGTSAGSGHPTSSMSAADVVTVLVSRHLRYDWDNPGDDASDHVIFSKGHVSPLLYSIFRAPGMASDEELMTGYRRFGSRLEGHPTSALPRVDVATGSLGQGLPDGVDIALACRYLDRRPYRVWVLCGGSEMAEGSVWEALDEASYYGLANLITILDVNRLGHHGSTRLQRDLGAYRRRAEAFGGRVIEVDGHDLPAVGAAAVSCASIRLRGAHAGVEIGADGPSQMALEDLAMTRAVHGAAVLYPSDSTSTAALVREMAGRPGISYLRTTRGTYPVLYEAAKTFPVGGAKVLRSGPEDAATLIGAGVTLHACLVAADNLAATGTAARVVDLCSVKPVDTAALWAAAGATGGHLVVAEDHRPEGGLGSAVMEALLGSGQPLRVAYLAVQEMPGSGAGPELMAAAGIDAAHRGGRLRAARKRVRTCAAPHQAASREPGTRPLPWTNGGLTRRRQQMNTSAWPCLAARRRRP